MESLPSTYLLISAELPVYQPVYHDLVPWQKVAQVCVAEFQTLRLTFLTPFMCVAAVTAVLL